MLNIIYSFTTHSIQSTLDCNLLKFAHVLQYCNIKDYEMNIYLQQRKIFKMSKDLIKFVYKIDEKCST